MLKRVPVEIDGGDDESRQWATAIRTRVPFISQEVLASIGRRSPGLKALSPQHFEANLAERALALGVTPQHTARALSTFPHFITIDPSVLVARSVRLAKLLNISLHAAVKLALDTPQVLALEKYPATDNLVRSAALLGLNEKELLSLAQCGDLALLYYPTDTLELKLDAFQKVLGVEQDMLRKLIVRKPQLLHLSPDTLSQNLNGLARLLEVSPTRAVALGRHHPQLFYQSVLTLRRNMEHLSVLLRIPLTKITSMVRYQPQLAFQNPQSVLNRITILADSLGVELPSLISAAARNPSLCTANPVTVVSNIDETTALLGMGRKDVLAFMLRQPQLLMAKPYTLAEKAVLLEQIATAMDVKIDRAALFHKHSLALSFSAARLKTFLNVATRGTDMTMGVLLKSRTSL